MNIEFDPAAGAVRTAAVAARGASRVLAQSSADQRNRALAAAAAALRASAAAIIAANTTDLTAYEGLPTLLDRLRLDETRVEAMAVGLEQIAALPDPLGHVLADWTQPNGLHFRRVSTPIGVIGMIYESRPNVGADAAGICLKSGNAVILRGGSDSFHSAGVIHAAMQKGLRAADLPEAAVQIAPGRDRAFVAAMLTASGLIDLIIPRGGKGLVTRVQAEARVPVLAHAEGLCHTYIHAAADLAMARRIMANAKMRRTDVCGATETLLIDAAIAHRALPLIVADLRALGCDFRADAAARAIIADLPGATEADFHTEWLDRVLSVRVVGGIDEAIAHIAAHGSEHTEAIVTEDAMAAEHFLNATSSAVVLWNASTQFCDGGEFGFGAEIGIATGRIQARGPVGPAQLTTFRYQISGTGQVRP
jgi:glutamate-5-semialdehyde dehydrogenase